MVQKHGVLVLVCTHQEYESRCHASDLENLILVLLKSNLLKCNYARFVNNHLLYQRIPRSIGSGRPTNIWCVHNAQQKSKGSTVSNGHQNLCDKQAAI